jgi:hypothetical protein
MCLGLLLPKMTPLNIRELHTGRGRGALLEALTAAFTRTFCFFFCIDICFALIGPQD